MSTPYIKYRTRWSGTFFLLFYLLLFTACSNREPTIEVIETTSPDLMPTISQRPTQTLPVFQPMPSLDEATLSDLFFGDSATSSCDLPCWQGIVVGESKIGAAFDAFETVFRLDANQHPPENINLNMLGLDVIAYSWANPEPYGGDIFRIQAWYDTNTDIIYSLGFYWDATEVPLDLPSPFHVLKERGLPSNIYALAEVGGTLGNYILFLVYDDGVTFYYISDLLTVNLIETEHEYVPEMTVCLDDTYVGYVKISLPNPDNQTIATSLQDWQYGEIEAFSLRPLDEVFGVSIKDIAQMISEDVAPCFTSEIASS